MAEKKLLIECIRSFTDNYIWLIRGFDNECAVVDPGDAQVVLDYINQHNLSLTCILLTHHHHDHIGGVKQLVNKFPSVEVIGPKLDNIPALTKPVIGGDHFKLFEKKTQVLALPGHTKGHIGFFVDGCFFCGDTLFSAGCGRIFEGTYEQMYNSLQNIASLPNDTKVYSAHEYTIANLEFALTIEPNNINLQKYYKDAQVLRHKQMPTLPTTIEHEKLINPFLRCHQKEVIDSVSSYSRDLSELSVFTNLRRLKDSF